MMHLDDFCHSHHGRGRRGALNYDGHQDSNHEPDDRVGQDGRPEKLRGCPAAKDTESRRNQLQRTYEEVQADDDSNDSTDHERNLKRQIFWSLIPTYFCLGLS